MSISNFSVKLFLKAFRYDFYNIHVLVKMYTVNMVSEQNTKVN